MELGNPRIHQCLDLGFRSKLRQKVFLLPLGGGVFNNPFKDSEKSQGILFGDGDHINHMVVD